MAGGLNDTLVALIPKVPCPKTIGQFRHIISLFNMGYKVITKLMVNRTKPIIKQVMVQSKAVSCRNDRLQMM